MVKCCHACQINRSMTALAPLHPCAQQGKPWSGLHIEFAGPLLIQPFFIVVDASSKWTEVDTTTTITAGPDPEGEVQVVTTPSFPIGMVQ